MNWLLILVLANPMLGLGSPGDTPLGGPSANLLGWLMRQNRPAAKAQQLVEILQDGEAVYLDGGTRSAAQRFGALLIDPAYAKLAPSATHDNVRYYLAGALAEQGASGKARRILLDLISAKPESAFRAPAFRKLIDLTLLSRQYEQTLKALSQLDYQASPLEKYELAYLRGKAILDLGHPDKAVEALASIKRSSRLFASATFLSGIIKVEAGQLDEAEDVFCKLIHQPGQGRYTFFLSDQAAQAIEHAWLAMARLHHDRQSYSRALAAYEHSAANPGLRKTAYYEMAWTLYRTGDLARALHLLNTILATDPGLSERPSAEILQGYILLGSCMFDQAQELFERLGGQLKSLSAAMNSGQIILGELPQNVRPWARPKRAELRVKRLSSATRRAINRIDLLEHEIARVGSGMPLQSRPRPRQKLLDQLNRDQARARFLARQIANLRSALGQAQNETSKLKELEVIGSQVSQVSQKAQQALDHLRQAELKREKMLVPDSLAPRSYLQSERGHLSQLRRQLLGHWTRTHKLAQEMEQRRLKHMALKVAAWARQASLGAVDASIGRKQALEMEVQNMALGRYPLSLLRELAEAGALDESMEYWPSDGEYWPDEYER